MDARIIKSIKNKQKYYSRLSHEKDRKNNNK